MLGRSGRTQIAAAAGGVGLDQLVDDSVQFGNTRIAAQVVFGLAHKVVRLTVAPKEAHALRAR